MQSELFSYLAQKREKYYQAWTEETASPKLRPITGKPRSTGQCSATSIVLQQDLQQDFEGIDTEIALGTAYNSTGKVLIDIHVWLYVYEDRYTEPLIVDITADQSTAIAREVVCEKASNMLKSEIVYQVHDLPQRLKTGTHERAVLLRSQLEHHLA